LKSIKKGCTGEYLSTAVEKHAQKLKKIISLGKIRKADESR
jgi:hypothetical protein